MAVLPGLKKEQKFSLLSFFYTGEQKNKSMHWSTLRCWVLIRWFWSSNRPQSYLVTLASSRLCNMHSNLHVYFQAWESVIKGILKLWLQTCSCSYSCSSTLTWTSCRPLSSPRSTWSSDRWGRSRRTCPRRAPCHVERRTRQPWRFKFWRLDEFVRTRDIT